jgi:hypothetical protein
MSFDADARPSNTSQPRNLTEIKYTKRNTTTTDHALPPENDHRRSQAQADFWNPTGQRWVGAGGASQDFGLGFAGDHR